MKNAIVSAILMLLASSATAQLRPSEQPHALNADVAYVAVFGDADQLMPLIEKGASGNAVDPDGVPALALAAKRKDEKGVEVIKLLLASGANINARDVHGQTALFYAARLGNLEAVKLLLDAGAEYYLTDKDGHVARNLAFTHGQMATFEYMDAFVDAKREAMNQRYQDYFKEQQALNEKAANDAVAKRHQQQEQAAKASGKTVLTPPTPTDSTKATLMQIAQHSCHFQYWYFVKSVQLKSELDAVSINTMLEGHKQQGDKLAAQLVQNNQASRAQISEVMEMAKLKIYTDLDKYGSNITRVSKGIGSVKDVVSRCDKAVLQ